MARIYQPLQIKEGPNAGRWRMCVSSDEEGWTHAVGLCADGCPGHDTAEQAVDHYDDGVAARATISEVGVQRCDVPECPHPAAHRAHDPLMVGMVELCSAHANAAGVRAALRARRKT